MTTQWLRIFILLVAASLGSGSVCGAQTSAWRWVEHKVQPEETLRVIARQYFGVKRAAKCLQEQLHLPDPDHILIGAELRILVPTEKYDLAHYRALEISCAPGKVDISKSVAPVEPEKPFTWNLSTKLGLGGSFIKINQSLKDSSTNGGSQFKSFSGLSPLAEILFTWNERWSITTSGGSDVGKLILPIAANNSQSVYHWIFYQTVLGFEPV